ncbi:hypothetical protein KM043_013071 [Ampulex compressa]|nr:hypothetical protein KM043_013071 [Ampulex compressa]
MQLLRRSRSLNEILESENLHLWAEIDCYKEEAAAFKKMFTPRRKVYANGAEKPPMSRKAFPNKRQSEARQKESVGRVTARTPMNVMPAVHVQEISAIRRGGKLASFRRELTGQTLIKKAAGETGPAAGPAQVIADKATVPASSSIRRLCTPLWTELFEYKAKQTPQCPIQATTSAAGWVVVPNLNLCKSAVNNSPLARLPKTVAVPLTVHCRRKLSYAKAMTTARSKRDVAEIGIASIRRIGAITEGC